MKRTGLLLTALLLVLVLAACGGDVGDMEPEASPPANTETPTDAPPRPEATATPDDYPAAPVIPTATPLPDDYPVPTPLAPATAYPGTGGQSGETGEHVWVLRPLGQQCEPESDHRYASLSEAVAALEDEGVEVLASETVNLMVCQACSCPTSEHFRAQIAPEDLATAESLGWTAE